LGRKRLTFSRNNGKVASEILIDVLSGELCAKLNLTLEMLDYPVATLIELIIFLSLRLGEAHV
jgi:hypothetical protein